MFESMIKIALWVAFALGLTSPTSWAKEAGARHRKAVLSSARNILENYDITYVYGGNALESQAACEACNTCLEKLKPGKNARLTACPSCRSCSLDCSHFTHLVYTNAGLETSYIPTQLMLELGPEALKRRFNLVDVGRDLRAAAPGDLLVYRGHVVLLEKVVDAPFGDIIHATSSELHGPGQGVQRRRYVNLQGFRGPLLRILRHAMLTPGKKPAFRPIKTANN